MAPAVVLLAITIAAAVAQVGISIIKAKQASKAATSQNILEQKAIDLDRAEANAQHELNALASVKALRATLASNAASFAGRGVVLNSGTPLRSAEENLVETNFQLAIDRLGLKFTNARLDIGSTAAIQRMGVTKQNARTNALGTSLDAAFSLGQSVASRGSSKSSGGGG